ncbi:MAG TPA: NlpC/P60 family protein [Flavisolibacter sp.]|nr:NlpC/P60 family protein [Flavisolibacter sp.]
MTATLVFFLGALQSLAQTSNSSKDEFIFLDDILVEAAPVHTKLEISTKSNQAKAPAAFVSKSSLVNAPSVSLIEKAVALQFKYSILMDIEVELVKNLNLFKLIDAWYGTRYRFGGISKKGIDCSGLMQIFFTALYGIALPRTAKEQYDFSRQISRSELREGDLVFFNTRGGVSHVGMYLTNNKFVHAASSSGVTISDLDESYYASRYIGAGRLDEIGSEESVLLIP